MRSRLEGSQRDRTVLSALARNAVAISIEFPEVRIANVRRALEHRLRRQRRCLQDQFGVRTHQVLWSGKMREQLVGERVVAREVDHRPLQPQRANHHQSQKRQQAVVCIANRTVTWHVVANVRKLFAKVVLVATGSGFGPMVGHLLDALGPSRLVWVTKNPRRTYGDQLIDEIEAAQSDATIWDTGERVKPDILRLAYAAYLESGAEAVVCIANRTVTWQVVHGLERRGIPAFGPIWDS